MDTNRYAPPKAAVADPSSTSLKRRSVILMIVLTILTFGLYYPSWFLRRRAALNRLDSPRKLQSWPFVIVIIWLAFQFFVGVAAGAAQREQELGQGGVALVLNIVQLAVGILTVVQSFSRKTSLKTIWPVRETRSQIRCWSTP